METVVDLKGKPMDRKTSISPREGHEILMDSIERAVSQWREGARMFPDALRHAKVNGSGVAHIIRSIRIDLEYIEKCIK